MAVKVLGLEISVKHLDELKKEIEILSHCNHPNITRYFGSMVQDRSLWVLTEFASVGSLREVVLFTLCVLMSPFTLASIRTDP